MIVNKPEQLDEVQCYKCKSVFKVHPMQCMNSPFITNCELHKPKCNHEHDGMIYTSNPPQNKCRLCGEFYR